MMVVSRAVSRIGSGFTPVGERYTIRRTEVHMAKSTELSVDGMNREARVRLITALEGKGAHLTFEAAVKDFPERLMNEKPAHVPYSFWHQLEHIRITQADMLSYIEDPGYVSPEWPKGYWPAQDAKTDASGWGRTIASFSHDRSKLLEVVKRPGVNLLEPVAHMENRSIFRAVLVIIDHNAYHLGEFVMARQILGAWKSELA
jgi:DinB superfamily